MHTKIKNDDRRKYIRHPVDINIEYDIEGCVKEKENYINDISIGGLSFKSNSNLQKDTIINIKIPLIKPEFIAKGKVKWCKKVNGEYEVGVEFLDKESLFKTRMVEQICHIEHYKREIYEKEGRKLNNEQAALEWIKKYAADF